MSTDREPDGPSAAPAAPSGRRPEPGPPARDAGPPDLADATARHALSTGFFAQTVHRPVAMLVAFATLLVVGVIAYRRIPLQMMPDGLTYPGLRIQVDNPGSSAAENERKVTRVIEEQVRTLAGIDRIESGSYDDGAWISVRFRPDTDMDVAKAEARDRVERARPQLPDTVEDVRIWSHDPGQMPVMWFALLHPGDSDRTDFLVDEVITRRLEAVDGAGRVQVWGLLDESVRILLDEDRVREARVDLGVLIARLRGDNFARPLGEITDGGRRFLLRSDMRFRDLDEIRGYPAGGGLTLADLGRVEVVQSVRDQVSRIDGRQAYFGMVQKESTANTVATSRRLKTELEALERDPRLAGEFEFRVLFAQGDFIESSLAQLRATAVWGGLLAVLILFLFLRRIRLTLCVALSIPVSSLLAIAWTYFTGGSFNILTMTGITLGIGMLVDNSVVVIENIARLRAEGRSGRTAAVTGTRDVALAVALATLTTVVVFLPLIFMGDNPMMRLMLGALGLPMCVSLVFSLLVALVFLPVAAARVVGDRPAPLERVARLLAPAASLPSRLVALAAGGLRALAHLLVRALFVLEGALLAVLAPLRWPLAVGVAALAAVRARAFLGGFEGVRELVPFELAPRSIAAGAVPGVVTGFALPAAVAIGLLLLGVPRWRARRGAPPARPARLVPRGRSLVDLLVAANRVVVGRVVRHRVAATACALATILSVQIPISRMDVSAFTQDEDRSRLDVFVDLEDNFTLAEASRELARYEAFLEPLRAEWGFAALGCRFRADWGEISLYWDESRSTAELRAMRERLRAELPRLPGHEVRFFDEETEEARSSTRVVFSLQGPDWDELVRAGALALETLREVPGLQDLSSPLADSPEQVRVDLDSDLASALGVTADSALQNIAWALRGFPLPRYQEAGREVPFYIEYDYERLAGLDTLRDLQVFTGQSVVPLSSFAEIAFVPGTRTIQRVDGRAAFTIQGRVDDPLLQGRVAAAGLARLRELDLPRGISVADDDTLALRTQQEMGALQNAALLGLVLVFLLMAILFESLILPFSVLTTIPFAVVGAYWALFLTGTQMDSVGWIGIIILIGVVVNNGIVLIDRVHRLRVEVGLERDAAVLEGSANRVRPILMTAMTTVCGLLPMALAKTESDGIDYRALATCVAGGLTLSTAFTVWVVPLAYTLMDDLGRATAAWTRWAFDLPRRAVRRRARPVPAPAPTEG